jgi:Arc/MetJ family transcription regulator
MKTTIAIPEPVLQEAIRHTGAKTNRDAVVTALEQFNRRERLAELASRLRGSLPNFMTQEDLEIMWEDSKWEASGDAD